MYRFFHDVSRWSICFPTRFVTELCEQRNIICCIFFVLISKRGRRATLAITFFTMHVRDTNSFSTLTISGYFNPFESSGTIRISWDGLTIMIIRYISYNAIIELYFILSDPICPIIIPIIITDYNWGSNNSRVKYWRHDDNIVWLLTPLECSHLAKDRYTCKRVRWCSD